MDEKKEKKLPEEETQDTLSEQEKEKVKEILKGLEETEEEKVSTDWDGLAQVGDLESLEEDDTDKYYDEDEDEDYDEDDEDDEDDDDEYDDFDDEIGEDEEVDEDALCQKCGKRKRFTLLDEDYPYCKSCREKMKKTKMNGWGVFYFIVYLFVGIAMIFFGSIFVTISAPVIKGDMYMAKNQYQSAIACYEEAMATVSALNQSAGVQTAMFDIGNATYAKLIEAYNKAGSPTYAQDYYSALEQSGALEKPRYKEAKAYYEVYDKMMDTYSFLSSKYMTKINTLYAAEKKSDVSEVKKELAELEKLKKEKKYDRYMVAYFQNMFCIVTENAEDQAIKYLEEIKSGGRTYEFIYAIELSKLYIEKGEYEKAEKICRDSLEASPENIGVYQYLMMAKRRQGDYEGALKIAKEAEKAVENIYIPEGYESAMHYSVPMEQAIVYALMGEEEKALAAIDKSFELGNSNENLNILILLHYLYHVKGTEPVEKDDGKVYDSVDEMYDQGLAMISYYGAYYGLKITDNIQAIMDGTKSLEDVFVKGEVDW